MIGKILCAFGRHTMDLMVVLKNHIFTRCKECGFLEHAKMGNDLLATSQSAHNQPNHSSEVYTLHNNERHAYKLVKANHASHDENIDSKTCT